MNGFLYAGLSHEGRIRKDNEDRWLAEPYIGLYLVADGMEGSRAGGLAARIVVVVLRNKIGRFEIRHRLGAGGFGAVYHAHDPTLQRKVAHKSPHPAAQQLDELRARTVVEARAAGKFRHPNIVPAYEASAETGPYHIASDFIEGRTLDEVLQRKGWDFHRAAELVANQAPPSRRTVNPKIPRRLDMICPRATARLEKDRYASWRELADHLQRWMEGQAVVDHRPAASEDIRGGRDSLSVAVAVMTVLFAVSAIVAAAAFYVQRSQVEGPAPAERTANKRVVENNPAKRIISTPRAPRGGSRELRIEVVDKALRAFFWTESSSWLQRIPPTVRSRPAGSDPWRALVILSHARLSSRICDSSRWTNTEEPTTSRVRDRGR